MRILVGSLGSSAAWLGSVALVGCLGGGAPLDRHYRLEAPHPSARLETPVFPGTLIVERPRGVGLADQRPLVYRSGRGSPELRQHAYSLWADAPTAMLQREIAVYLRDAGVADEVITSDLLADGDFVLAGRLIRLERVLEGEANVELVLELAVLGGPHRELTFHATYRALRPAGESVEASVVALREALGDVLGRFVDDAAGASSQGE